MELLKSTIYLREYLYTTTQGFDIEYRALSYKELDNIRDKYTHKTNTLLISTVKLSLLNMDDFRLLTSTDIDYLYDNIMHVSTVHSDDISSIKSAVTVSLEDSFTDSTFKSCELCKSKNLDKKRNCPYLGEEHQDSGVFYLIGGKKIDKCPMDKLNSSIVSDGFKCYNMYDKGMLPTTGGLYDQTMFYVEVSSIIKNLISIHTNKELEKIKE